ncbi:trypsin-like peptidase domain-containing protein [Spongiivirga sp. MCCC 1A20706]|uniref:trypsin-like peptidase domain-containing protein n=1 Tax=Spongiivirga sp. MCCC 1A20706 TaxID=3160963 RepID=UPI003977B69B
MKKLSTLILASIIGGAFTLGFYKIALEKEKPQEAQTISQTESTFIPTTYSTNNTRIKSAAIDGIDFTNAAEKTVNSVVHVKNRATGSASNPIYDFFYGRSSKSRVREGSGSGVIISPDGHIITNNHVIEGADELEVTLNNNKSYPAILVGSDPKTDIAVLKIEADSDLNFIAFGDSDNVRVGEWVLAVGNPFNLTSTVTAGIISAKARDLNEFDQQNQSFLQTDAAVNPGNSGGALVNTNGDLIGINTAITSQTGSFVGYSFAVPSNIAKKVVDDLLEFGNVQKGVLGITTINRNSPEAVEKGIDELEGVYVAGVEVNSGADKGGIKTGDVIKKIDRVRIRKFADLTGYLNSKRPNETLNVVIDRDGRRVELPVTLSKFDIFEVDFLGMKLRNISADNKEKYNIENGVIVNDLDKGSVINRSTDVSTGYILTEINGTKINSIRDIEKLKKKNIQDKLEKITFLNRQLEAERYIFRD